MTGTAVPAPVVSRVITVPSGDLFTVAAQYLGDATRWNEIAALNGMMDPFFNGILSLRIPAIKGTGNGGILGL